MTHIRKIIFSIIFIIISFTIYFIIFHDIYYSNNITFYYAIHPFNICEEQPEIWNIITISSIIFYIFSNFIFSYLISKNIFNKKNNEITTIKKEIISPLNLSLDIGYDNKNNLISLTEKSCYQNILITGTIGTGKTSSAMYPLTKQLIEYKSNNTYEKLGMLILDVKGNYHLQVKKYCEEYERENDLITIDLSQNIKYNPLDKPNLKASVLANRLKTILLLFSPNNTESFWLDKVEQILAECIKLCRLYNNGYVTFEELHNLVVIPNYYEEKIELLRKKFLENNFSKEDSYHLLSSLNFFEKEYSILDERTKSILKSEITRITNVFLSDYSVKKVFCPKKNEINFFGFKDVIETGKIVVLNLNISEYKNLSKLIAAYLKLDFQTEVLNRLSNSSNLENKRSVFYK